MRYDAAAWAHIVDDGGSSMDAPAVLTREEAWDLAGAAATCMGQLRACSHERPTHYGLGKQDLQEEPPRRKHTVEFFRPGDAHRMRERTEKKPRTPQELERLRRRSEYMKAYHAKRKAQEAREQELGEMRAKLDAAQLDAQELRARLEQVGMQRNWERAQEAQEVAVELMRQRRAAFFKKCSQEYERNLKG